jgi:hypothetical protein
MRRLFTICGSGWVRLVRAEISALSLFCLVSVPSFSDSRSEPLVWKLKQQSGVIGPHLILFNDSGFCIDNLDTNTRTFGDTRSGKVFYANPTAKLYCELNKQNISILHYYLSNLTVGTFHDLRMTNLGKEKFLGRIVTKYGGNRADSRAKSEKDYPVIVRMLDDEKTPPFLMQVVDYIYGISDIGGLPVSIYYEGAQTGPKLRLQTTSIVHEPDPHFSTTPLEDWHRAKSQKEIDLRVHSSDLFDSMFGSAH